MIILKIQPFSPFLYKSCCMVKIWRNILKKILAKKFNLTLFLFAFCLFSACSFTACGQASEKDSSASANPTNTTDWEENFTAEDTTGKTFPEEELSEEGIPEGNPSAEAFPGEELPGENLPAKELPMESSTPVSLHGALRVNGAELVDQYGENFQLYGMSTHNLAWFPQYVSYDTFQTLRDDWNTNCIRLAMYTAEQDGYCTGGSQEDLKALVKEGVDYATELDMYVIIDWHILSDQDPNVYKQDALAFFEEMSAAYADYDNVLYEICNEPNGYATWESVKAYAEEVIPVIRSNDSDAIILVGSPCWSQNIDQAAADPLAYDNLLYTLHFYAGTHKDDLRNRLKTCVDNGLPVFISEFGMCDASGNGANDFESARKWLDLIEEYQLSFLNWNLANKAETSSAIQSGSDKISHWTEEDLSESGKWIRTYFQTQ